MLDFLFDASYWREGISFMVISHQAGFNMIPTLGVTQALEAWAADRAKK